MLDQRRTVFIMTEWLMGGKNFDPRAEDLEAGWDNIYLFKLICAVLYIYSGALIMTEKKQGPLLLIALIVINLLFNTNPFV